MTAVQSAWAQGGATAEFARFVATTRSDDVPPEVVEAVKRVVLDTVAVAVSGTSEPGPLALAELMHGYGGAPVATVIGMPFRSDPATAALLNGMSAHALDYDDYCFAMSGHPSVVLLPPILALAEQRGLSGIELIRAYAVGFEAAIMLSHTVNPDHYGHGWHGTGTVGAVGAACAAANLLGLSEEQATNAISVGASMAAGLRQNFGTDVKPLHAGNAARAGVLAAELASSGFAGDHEIFEGGWGFFNTFTGGPARERQHPEMGFGAPWSTLEPGITTKLFPSCGSTHASIGSALALRDQGLRVEDVDRIDVAVTDISAGNLQYPRPRTGLEGKFSMQYCVARALTNGLVALDHFTAEAVADPAMQDLMGRIYMHDDERLNAAYEWGQHRPAVMTVTTRDGRTLVQRTDAPPGSPGNFSEQALRDKVADCLGRGAVVGSAEQISGCVLELDTLDDVGGLTALLAAPP